MENSKIDLKDLKGQEWEKYRKMRKVATNNYETKESIAFLIIEAILVIGFISILLQVAPSVRQIEVVSNYSVNQFNATVHQSSLLPIFNNINNSKGINNNTANTLTTVLQNNPKALATFATANFFYNAYFQILTLLIAGVFGFIVIYWFLSSILSRNEGLELPTRFKFLRNRLARLQKRDERLREYGFTEKEIAWYHAVRSELIKLELECVL